MAHSVESSGVRQALSQSLLAFLFVASAMPATAQTGDLSQYRGYKLGADVAAVAKQAGLDPSQARVIQRRPALIQELEWRPQPAGSSSRTEPAKDVVFSFYDGALFRIAVNYDRYETEGMTADDLAESISVAYGAAARPTAPAKTELERYGDQEAVLARWQDPDYRFELTRSSYGSSYKLVGVLKKLEAPVQAAMLEAARLDEKEAPQREAERIARDGETERAKMEKARLVNKPKFRP